MLVLSRKRNELIEVQTPADPAALATLIGGELFTDAERGGLAIRLPDKLTPAVATISLVEIRGDKARLGLAELGGGQHFVFHRHEVAEKIRQAG